MKNKQGRLKQSKTCDIKSIRRYITIFYIERVYKQLINNIDQRDNKKEEVSLF